MNKIIRRGFVIVALLVFAYLCTDRLPAIHLLSWLPENILEKMHDHGLDKAYSALHHKYYHASIDDRIIFYSKMAKKGIPGAACEAVFYLNYSNRLEQSKKLFVESGLKEDECESKGSKL